MDRQVSGALDSHSHVGEPRQCLILATKLFVNFGILLPQQADSVVFICNDPLLANDLASQSSILFLEPVDLVF